MQGVAQRGHQRFVALEVPRALPEGVNGMSRQLPEGEQSVDARSAGGSPRLTMPLHGRLTQLGHVPQYQHPLSLGVGEHGQGRMQR